MTSMYARVRRCTAILLAVALCMGLASCAHTAPETRPTNQRLAWPPPPDPPRVVYEGAFSTPAELGIRAGWLRRTVRRLFRGPETRSMERPLAVASAPGGAIAVADTDGRCVHVFDVTRKHYRRIQQGSEGALASPVGVVFDGAGSLLVADSGLDVVLRFDSEGTPRERFPFVFARPTGLAYDRLRDVLYVVDTGAHRVYGFDPAGRTVFDVGGRGAGPGQFNYPVGVTTDDQGRVWVTDTMNFRVQLFEPSGKFVRAFGRQGHGPGDVDKIKGVAIDPDGHVWVVEGLHDVINVYDQTGALLTVIGSTGDGPGQFLLPTGIHIDPEGHVLVADSANGRVQRLTYLPDRTVSGVVDP